jgi:hypothetical protein
VPENDNARNGKVYKSSKLPIGGMHVKIDCVYQIDGTSNVLEWKVKAELDKADRVQLFLYIYPPSDQPHGHVLWLKDNMITSQAFRNGGRG